jgi:hypothetical protein
VNTPPEAACEACGKSIAHRLSRWEESGRKGRKPALCSREDNPDCHRNRAAARKQLSRGKQSAKPTVPGEFAADVTVSLDCAEPRGGRRRKYCLKGRIIAKRRKKSREVVVRFLPAPLQVASTPVGRLSEAVQPESVPFAPRSECGRPTEVLAWIDVLFAELDKLDWTLPEGTITDADALRRT